MCYGGGFDGDHLRLGTSGDPDNPNSYPYYDIPGGMHNASGYANHAFHAARQDPKGYPRQHCEPSWKDQTNWATKWANEAIEDAGLRAAIDAEVTMLSNVATPSLAGLERQTDIATAGKAVDLGGTKLTLSPTTGAIIGMVDARGGRWAGESNPLALFE